jgi:spermidine synthase
MALSKNGSHDEQRSAARIILLCFFASGFSGLVYQVIWVRELVLVFGATTFAISTVLTAFMGGLALGSFYFGRRSVSAKDPLRLYALLEIGIGVYGLLVPFIFAALPIIYQPLWRWLQLSFFTLSIVRFLFAGLVLILPTALMGATLPVLASHYARERSRVGLHVGALYTVNTLGAVLGAAATGFVLIPTFGIRFTTCIAAAINILLGYVALKLSRVNTRKSEESVAANETHVSAASETRRPAGKKAAKKRWFSVPQIASVSRQGMIVVLAAFALSGFIALSYEVIWSRVLALIIGSSVYAFSIMLATFLIGLALGAALISRFVDGIGNRIRLFAVVELGVGLTSLLGAYLFNELPFVFVQLYRALASSSLGLLLISRFLIAAAVMILPTLLLGALFPLVIKIVASNEQATGRSVGDAYASNTLGAIVGSFASGFILIPALGLQGSLKLCVALNFVIAAALFLVHKQHSASDRKADKQTGKGKLAGFSIARFAGVTASILLIVMVTFADLPWNSDVMSSAVYRYAPSMSNFSRQDFLNFVKNGQGETVFYKEGITATVAVQKVGKDRVLKVNGKPEASTAGDMPTQILIGAMPLLLREKTEEVLLIGLGSGVTLGSIEQFPIKRVTCVELEPAVVEASQEFNDVNNRPLEDERLRLLSNDGRNFIYTTSEKFDVIVSEPSNPWLTGVANLFTLEYFKRGAKVLNDDGIFCQWLQLYEMHPEDVRSLVATFKAAFPYAYLFRGAEGDLILIGSKQERKLDLNTINAHLADPKIVKELSRVRSDTAGDLISRLYFGNDEIVRYAAGSKLNTDDNALIEFNAPRRVGSAEETVEQNVKQLLASAASPLPYLSGDMPKGEADFLVETALGAIKRDDQGRAEQFARYSLNLTESAQAHGVLGEILSARGDDAAALDEWQAALVLDPKNFYALIDIGKYYLSKQDAPRAAGYLERAIEIDAKSARARHLRGLAYQEAGDLSHAAAEYRQALEDAKYTRNTPTFYLNFGTALLGLGLEAEATQMLEEYTKLAPNDFDGHFQLGVAYERLSSHTLEAATAQKAVNELKRALTINSKHPASHYYLSRAYRRLELYDLADTEFEIYERLAPQ